MAANLDGEILRVASTTHAHVETLIGLVQYNNVLLGVGPEEVAPDVVVSLRDLILGRVEQRPRVRGPGNLPNSLSRVGKDFAGAQITDMQRVLPEPARLRGI